MRARELHVRAVAVTVMAAALILRVPPARAAAPAHPSAVDSLAGDSPDRLMGLSPEELADVKVTSVSKRPADLRFDVNRGAAAGSGLRISSRLLQLAREVGGSAP